MVALENMKRRMTQKSFAIALVAALALLGPNARGQISITGGGGLTYSQNFDTLTRNTTAETWVNDADTTSAIDSPQRIGLLGWYCGSFGTTFTTPQIRAGTGSSTTGAFYSFGLTPVSDRALGTLPSDASASASMRIGARFVNNTGETITGLTLSYDGEQWRQAAVTAINNSYTVAYAIFGAGSGTLNPAAGVYTTITSAEFNTPQDGNGTGVALDGNLTANRVAGLSGTVTGLSVANGEEIRSSRHIRKAHGCAPTLEVFRGEYA